MFITKKIPTSSYTAKTPPHPLHSIKLKKKKNEIVKKKKTNS